MNTYVGITDFIGPNDLNLDALAQSDWVYIEGHLLIAEPGYRAALKARDEARRLGKKIAVNFCDPAVARLCRERMTELLSEKVDLLFCNEEEAAIWAYSEDQNEAMETLDTLANTWALTLGEEGAIVYDGDKREPIAAHKVNAVSTLGAGDTFAGAFMYGLTQNMSYKHCGELASLASAELVQQSGPRLSKAQLSKILTKFTQ
jgi:sugar/nucleoside kinase (ribokinase family)